MEVNNPSISASEVTNVPFQTQLSAIKQRHAQSKEAAALAKKLYEEAAATYDEDQSRMLEEARSLIRQNGGWPKDLELQIIMLCGFNESVRSSIIAFNAKLKEKMGQLILFAHTHHDGSGRPRRRWGGMEPLPMVENMMPNLEDLEAPLRTDFYIGRIDRELSLSELEQTPSLTRNGNIIPVGKIIWENVEGKIQLRSSKYCVEFPTDLFLYHIRGLDKESSFLGTLHVTFGDQEIKKVIQNMEYPYAQNLSERVEQFLATEMEDREIQAKQEDPTADQPAVGRS